MIGVDAYRVQEWKKSIRDYVGIWCKYVRTGIWKTM